MLVYNGHGTQSDTPSPAGVRLELWDSTSMRADELHALLDGHASPVRWVFTQCYSGGFHRLAYDDPDVGLDLAEGRRCGFTSESAYRLAEGCSASIETDDYRDYSTFLFAALDGAERDGDPLFEDPDADADGAVSPREAHLYALEHAHSSDLSRSTSEDFLDAWQPWWLRWLPQPARVPENEYARLYRELSARVGIALDRGPDAIREAMDALEVQIDALAERRAELRVNEELLGGDLAYAVAGRWPALLGPYTDAYRELAASGELEAVAREIESMPEYAELVDAQGADAALDDELIEAERGVRAAPEAAALPEARDARGAARTVGQRRGPGGVRGAAGVRGDAADGAVGGRARRPGGLTGVARDARRPESAREGDEPNGPGKYGAAHDPSVKRRATRDPERRRLASWPDAVLRGPASTCPRVHTSTRPCSLGRRSTAASHEHSDPVLAEAQGEKTLVLVARRLQIPAQGRRTRDSRPPCAPPYRPARPSRHPDAGSSRPTGSPREFVVTGANHSANARASSAPSIPTASIAAPSATRAALSWPSSIFSASPSPAFGKLAQNTPSAPTLTNASGASRSMIAVSMRSRPATRYGCAASASWMRATAARRVPVSAARSPKRAIDSASRRSGSASDGTPAAVVAPRQLHRAHAREVAQHLEPAPLHRILVEPIAGVRLAERQRGGEHADVLARAVVVDALGPAPLAEQLVARGDVQGELRAALERVVTEPEPLEPVAREPGVDRLAVVRRARERDVPVVQAEALDGTGFDERDRLQELDGAPREDRALHVAQAQHRAPRGVDDGDRAAVAALDRVAAPAVDEDRVHRMPTAARSSSR